MQLPAGSSRRRWLTRVTSSTAFQAFWSLRRWTHWALCKPLIVLAREHCRNCCPCCPCCPCYRHTARCAGKNHGTGFSGGACTNGRTVHKRVGMCTYAYACVPLGGARSTCKQAKGRQMRQKHLLPSPLCEEDGAFVLFVCLAQSGGVLVFFTPWQSAALTQFVFGPFFMGFDLQPSPWCRAELAPEKPCAGLSLVLTWSGETLVKIKAAWTEVKRQLQAPAFEYRNINSQLSRK